VRHHEASRGPMATLESLLTSCVPDGCGVSTRAFVQTRPSARKIIPASITSPLLRPSAPRQHVLTSTIHAPPQPTASESTPHSALLNRSLARAGCNPEFCRPRTPSPKVHSLLLVTEVLLSSPPKQLSADRWQNYGIMRAVRGLMIRAETHAGTVSLLLTLPTSPRCLGVRRDTYTRFQ
jgi:hypothetical protein